MNATQTPSKVTIPVTGMTCAACSSRVQRALAKTPGVTEASVNLMMENAVVGYDPSAVDPGALVEVIRDTGYGAEIASAERTAFEEQEAQDRAQEEEFRELRGKALVTMGVAAVAMLVSMPLMEGEHGAHGAVADPFMRWAMALMSSLLNGRASSSAPPAAPSGAPVANGAMAAMNDLSFAS